MLSLTPYNYGAPPPPPRPPSPPRSATAYPPPSYPPPANGPYPPSSASPPAYNPSTASYSPPASSYPYHSPQPPQQSQQSASPTSLAGVELSSLPLLTGTVRWFNPAKGYGFIAPSDGSPHDAFVHQNQLQSDGFRALERDQIVEFRMRVDPNTGKHIALAVTAPGGGKLPAGRRDEDREPFGGGGGGGGGFGGFGRGDRDRDGGRGPPPSFRFNDTFASSAPSHSSADTDARSPPYDGRNARPPGVPFCVGVVKSFDMGKGFGFLTQLYTASGQSGGGDIFVHQTNVHMEGRRELVEGMMLEYVEGTDEKNGKPLAKNVTGRNGSLITRQDVEAAAGQQRRPYASQQHSYAPPPPHSPQSRLPFPDDQRLGPPGSRDAEHNGGSAASSPLWHRGTVLTFDPVKRYGFIKPDLGGENMFLHATHCDVPMEELTKGVALEYQTGVDQKGKECALKIRRVQGAGGYGAIGRQRSPHRAPAPYARDGRGMSPGRARYEGYDARQERDRGEYRRGFDRRTPPRDYAPAPPAYPPPPAAGYPPPASAQQPPQSAPSAYYDSYRSDPRYAPPPAAAAPGYPPQPPPAAAPVGYDSRYALPAPAPYYPPPSGAPTHPPSAVAANGYYGQHSAPAQPPAPPAAASQYYYPPPQATNANQAAIAQYAYPPPPLTQSAAQSAAPPAAAAAPPAHGSASAQPNQLLAHLQSLYSTLSTSTSTATQQPNGAPPPAPPAAAPAARAAHQLALMPY